MLLQVSTGLGGRVLLELQNINPGVAIKAHKLDGGKPVTVSWLTDNGKTLEEKGVVWRSTTEALTVAIDEYPSLSISPPVSVSLAYDDYTHRVLCSAIRDLQHNKALGLRMVSVLFGHEPSITAEPSTQDAPPRNHNSKPSHIRPLNYSQEKAVTHALNTQDISVIHGPPGMHAKTATNFCPNPNLTIDNPDLSTILTLTVLFI